MPSDRLFELGPQEEEEEEEEEDGAASGCSERESSVAVRRVLAPLLTCLVVKLQWTSA